MDAPKTMDLDVDGTVVKVTVTCQHSEALAAWGFPPERYVYSVSWEPCQTDSPPIGPTAAARRLRWPRRPGTWDMSGSR
jgi:hypothetical protein